MHLPILDWQGTEPESGAGVAAVAGPAAVQFAEQRFAAQQTAVRQFVAWLFAGQLPAARHHCAQLPAVYFAASDGAPPWRWPVPEQSSMP